VLTTDQKGAVAEAEIAAAAIKLGIGVYKPLSDGERYDLIFDLRPLLIRVQCKWGALTGDVVVVRCYSCRRSRVGQLKRTYTADEVDAIAAYCEPLDKCYWLPTERFAGRTHVQLRVHPSRNNQRLGINWADEFAFNARLMELLGP
jgi:hypothetical protein